MKCEVKMKIVKMKWIFCVFLILKVNVECVNVFIAQNITNGNPCTDENHLFLAPGVLTAGSSNRVCLSRFHPEGPARLMLTLQTEDKQMVTAIRELPTGDGGCVDILVPLLPNTKAQLFVNVRYPEARCSWDSKTSVRISSGRLVVAHTERARYRPGDTVRIRVLTLKPELTPAHGYVEEIWLEGPRGVWEGTRAAYWHRVRTRFGIAQVQQELDGQAPTGKWTVRAKMADGSQGSADFWVGNYDLPPFQLSVRHSPRVLKTNERLVWTVCVRYPWTEGVEGMLVIRLRGAGGDGTSNHSGVRTAVRLRAPRACHRHAVASRRVGLDGANPPDVIVADFSFQEDGTRIWQNTTVVSEVIDKPVFLEFLVKHKSDIPPGLPYNLKVKAIRWDDKPALNERVIVCRSPAKAFDTKTQSSNETCGTSVTDINGIARVIFEPDDDGSPLYKFEASLHNDSRISAPPLYLPADRSSTIHAGLGALKWDMFAVRSYIPLYLNIRNISTPLTVHFVVVTRGGIIHKWGSTTQCPLGYSTNQVQSVSRNAHCDMARLEATQNDLNATADTYDASDLTSDALYSRHSPRVMLSIKVTHQMCPDSHMIAYFSHNGHLVSASKHIEKEDCFVNKVEATWLSRQVLPGSMAILQLTTPGPAICALTALDTASKWIQPAPSIKEAILTGLRRLIDTHRNLTEYDVAGDCLIYEDTMDMPRNSIELTARRLATAGVKVVGSGLVERRKCEPRAPAPLRADEDTPPRSDFSEAWLWRLVSVSSNGSTLTSARAPDSITRFEANAMCLTRHGVSISSPAVLQVYREFFIHADSPGRLRQGDVTIIRYRIFNYLYEPLSVQIQLITDSNLRATSDAVESVCIGARASVARRAEVRAERPGHAGSTGDALLRIRAKAVNDGNCNGTSARPGISDEVIIKIQVDPEGVPIQEYRSTLLCGKDNPESSSSDVSWAWPSVKSVPGTETLTVWAVADVTGPLLADADSLVLLPRGCGEQNMARLATNLLALTQLDPRSPQAAVSQKHVATGFTRQLQYLHPLGGFSAFGSSDSTPSTWLTAFSLRYLRKAHRMISPNLPTPPALEKAEKWLLNQQMENGCFRNEGQVFHRELKGGLEEDSDVASVALTAYVITSLIESSTSPQSRVLWNTLSCLRALPLFSTKSPSRVYAHALLAYAFMRLKRYEEELKSTNEASLLWEKKVNVGAGLQQDEEMKELLELLRMARRTNEYVWWETASLSTSIEATSYAILALSSCPRPLLETCARDARAATRWLCTHRNAAGGFVSTQDTLVALEALTAWSSVQPSLPANLTVTARSKAVKKIKLTSDTKVPELMKMGVADTLSVSVEGTGCALVQATRAFRSVAPSAPSSGSLGVKVSVHTDGPFDCDTSNTTCFCAAIVEACVLWSGMFPEMALLEVALPGGFGADAARLYSQLHEPNTLLRRIEMSTNSGRVTLYLGTADGSDAVARAGHQCYQIHAVGPQTKTKPAFARLTDYYKTAINSTQMYTIPEECLPRINHEPEKYLTSDNLFIKSKSLDDNGEILISDEFSFEDIPEGIPLEDPLYDNLTQTDDKEKSGVKKKSLGVDNATRTEIDETGNGDNKTDDIDMVTQSVIIEEEDFQNQQVNLTYEPKIEINKTVNVNVPSDSEVVAEDDNLETTSKIEPLKESDNEVSKTLIGNKNEVRNVATDSDQTLKIENPKLSDFHVINSDTDLEVPTGIEGPVPVMVLPPQNFMNQQRQTELQTPRRRNNLGTLQTYFYTPFNAYYPPVRQNYYLRGFTT